MGKAPPSKSLPWAPSFLHLRSRNSSSSDKEAREKYITFCGVQWASVHGAKLPLVRSSKCCGGHVHTAAQATADPDSHPSHSTLKAARCPCYGDMSYSVFTHWGVESQPASQSTGIKTTLPVIVLFINLNKDTDWHSQRHQYPVGSDGSTIG